MPKGMTPVAVEVTKYGPKLKAIAEEMARDIAATNPRLRELADSVGGDVVRGCEPIAVAVMIDMLKGVLERSGVKEGDMVREGEFIIDEGKIRH